MGAPLTRDQLEQIAETEPATSEWLAKQDFEPWDVASLPVPSPQEWAGDANQRTLILELATKAMSKSKDDLVDHARILGAPSFLTLMEHIIKTRDWFEAWTDLLNAAETRLLVAAAVLEIEEATS